MIRFPFPSIFRAFKHLVLAGLLCLGARLPANAGILATAKFEGRTYRLLDTDGTKWWDAAQAEAIAGSL